METSAKTGLNTQEFLLKLLRFYMKTLLKKKKKLKDIEDKKTKNKNINKPKEKIKQKKIQIVAFSTDDTDYTPIYIINIFLGNKIIQFLKNQSLLVLFIRK